MKKNLIYKLEENISSLKIEITKFKKHLKNESKKEIKMSQFIKYFDSVGNTFFNTRLELIWVNSILTQKFLTDISSFSFNDIIPLILKILCGNFDGVIKKKKLVDLKKPNQKLISFYLLPLHSNKNLKILFSLCLKAHQFSDKVSTHIIFLSISQESEYEKEAKLFYNQVKNDDINFPFINYDKSGLLTSEILISHKITDKNTGIEICYPLQYIPIKNNEIFDSKIIHRNLIKISNNPNDFLINDLNDNLIDQIENNNIENIIISAIEGENLDIKLSLQEKKVIKNSNTYILSGRAGTGKTTVILFKLFRTYFNYQIKKRYALEDIKIKTKNNKINITNEIKIKKPTDDLRVVFTSLSQNLCEMQQMIIQENIISKIYELEFIPIDQERMKLISSFRDLYNYPIFINFRKLLFMIDGSLTFQYFKRHNLKIFEGNKDAEFEYILNNEYEVNNYEFQGDPNYLNFFYRSPKFKGNINKKEANENTFFIFYNNFISKRKQIPLAQKIFDLHLKPIEIYAQHISIIKGSYMSHLYMDNCISKEDYKNKGKKITDLPGLDDIYDLCILYEKYKKNHNLFDIQDLVNFLIREVKAEFFNKNIKLIDYIFIDEVQDLAINQIYLLMLVSKYCKIFAGDTCQTISKTKRFRFSELGTVFYNFKKIIPDYPKVENAYLCLNYRLNSKILKLTTFIAHLIKLLFPNTIDDFQDDFSLKIIDQKPVLLNDISEIINNIKNNQGENDSTKNYSLYSNHCFICFDEADKNYLKDKDVFNLNVDKIKGMEYELIIVYNFFTRSNNYELWQKIFNKIGSVYDNSINNASRIQLSEVLNSENLSYILKTTDLENIYNNYSVNDIEEKIFKEIDSFIYPAYNNNDFDKHKFFDFCSELKKFYVVITRPKTFLAFYEQNSERSNNNNFYKFMINNNLISTDNQQNFITSIIKFFNMLKKNFSTKNSLRILGNKAFNEGDYSRAVYSYKKAGEIFLQKLSEIFVSMEEIKELANTPDKNEVQFKKLNEKVVTIIEEIEEKNNEDFYIEKPDDDNKINIIKCKKKLTQYKLKCLIYSKQYEKAIKLCQEKRNSNSDVIKNRELINIEGMIYFKYKHSYDKAFELFKQVNNYKYAMLSLENDKNVKTKSIFNYANEIIEYLGVIEYNEIYLKYIPKFFNEFITKEKPINEYFSISKNDSNSLNFAKYSLINNKNIVLIDNKIAKYVIKDFFEQYLDMINNTINKNEKIEKSKELTVDNFKILKEDFNLSKNIIQYVNAFYFNIKKDLYLEFIKICPKILFYKIEIEINDDKNKSIDNELLINNEIKSCLSYIINHAELTKIKNIKDYFLNFLILHGFSIPIKEILSDKEYLIFNFTLNFDFLIKEDFSTIDSDLYIYYCEYNIRRELNNLIINNNLNYKEDNNFRFNYKILFGLIKEIRKIITADKQKNKNNSNELNYFLKPSLSIFHHIEDIIVFVKVITNNSENSNFIDNKILLNLLDIGSYISLYLFHGYYYNDYAIQYEDITIRNVYRLFKFLYYLSNLISGTVAKLQNNEKLILFSLFNSFYSTPIPNFEIFKCFQSINGCLLNKDSPLFKNYYFQDEFSNNYNSCMNIDENELSLNYGNNLFIDYNILCDRFKFMLCNLVINIMRNVKKNYLIKRNYYGRKFISGKSLTKEYSKISSILYYYTQLNYYPTTKNKMRTILYWENVNRKFSKYKNYFPSDRDENKFANFYLEYYLIDLFVYDNIEPDVLISFIYDYYMIQKEIQLKLNKDQILLLLFIIKERWSKIKLPKKFQLLLNEFFPNEKYFSQLEFCLSLIYKEEAYILTSIYILRRIFPIILAMIKKYFNFHKIDDINIYIYQNEQIYFNLDIKEKIDNNNIKIFRKIISLYFNAIYSTICKFSESGRFYCEIFKRTKEMKNIGFLKKLNDKKNFEFYNMNETKEKEIIEENKEISSKNIKNNEIDDEYNEFEKYGESGEESEEEDDELEVDEEEISDDEDIICELYNNSNSKNSNTKINRMLKKKIKQRKLNEKNGQNLLNSKKEENTQEEYIENIVTKMDQYFYYPNINSLIDYENQVLEKLLLFFYQMKNENLKVDYNEFYHLFEISFFSIYLSLIELNNLFESSSDRIIKEIKNEILDVIKVYEEKSFYINFVDEEGAKYHIKKLINEQKRNNICDYSDLKKLRNYFLENSSYKLLSKNECKFIKLKNKKLSEFLSNNQTNKCNIDIIFRKKKEEMFTNKNTKKVGSFLKKINQKNIIGNKKEAFFESYINHFIEINQLNYS